MLDESLFVMPYDVARFDAPTHCFQRATRYIITRRAEIREREMLKIWCAFFCAMALRCSMMPHAEPAHARCFQRKICLFITWRYDASVMPRYLISAVAPARQRAMRQAPCLLFSDMFDCYMRFCRQMFCRYKDYAPKCSFAYFIIFCSSALIYLMLAFVDALAWCYLRVYISFADAHAIILMPPAR